MTTGPAATTRTATRLADAGIPPDASIIVVHVSAGNPFRRWSLEKFVELLIGLARGGQERRIVVTSGPSEQDAAVRVIAAARARLESEAHRVFDGDEWPLDELRALLDRAALFIGGDSGPLHVAATTAVPIVGLYGPTLPVRSGPWRSPQLIHEPVEIADLPCRPCDQRVCVPGDFRCLGLIAPADVLAASARALARATTSRSASADGASRTRR